MKNLTIADAAWLAGIIDGEGSIFIMKQRRKDRERDTNYILRMTVQSCDLIMAPYCLEITGEGVVFNCTEKRENQSNSIKWELHGKRAIKVLKEILPYMQVKKDQALAAIEFQETTKKHWRHMDDTDYKSQEEFYWKLKQLKQDEKLGNNLYINEVPLHS